MRKKTKNTTIEPLNHTHSIRAICRMPDIDATRSTSPANEPEKLIYYWCDMLHECLPSAYCAGIGASYRWEYNYYQHRGTTFLQLKLHFLILHCRFLRKIQVRFVFVLSSISKFIYFTMLLTKLCYASRWYLQQSEWWAGAQKIYRSR